MKVFRDPAIVLRFFQSLLCALALSPVPLLAADAATPLNNLVTKYTEQRTPQATPLPATTTAQATAQPVALSPVVPAKLGPEPTKTSGRKPSPSLESLSKPKASGPLRILLVDDDASSNNAGGDTGVAERSDKIYRELVSNAVGGKAEAWAVEVVKSRENGPAFERLRDFNVVLWYTGSSYGANNDTIGRDDEKTLRHYLEEVGGAVIIVSPGYVNNLVYGQSWEAAEHPFLKEVLAVNGCYGLVQRGARGTVRAANGTTFQVEHPGATEAQFSTVNPDGAAIVFTSSVDTTYAKQEGGLPVAVANSYGSGRIVYVGFTFENIPETERTQAFKVLLDAAGASPGGAVAASRGVTDPAHEFAVLGSAHTMFNFSASQAGPIQIQVRSQGKPITVTVHHPDGRKVQTPGAASLLGQEQVTFYIRDQVTDADLIKGHVWGVSVRATPDTTEASVVARGTISVTHPPADAVAVQQQKEKYAAQITALSQTPALMIDPATPTVLRQIATVPSTGTRTPTLRSDMEIQTIKPVIETPPAPINATSGGIVPGIVTTVQFAGKEPAITRVSVPRGKAGTTVQIWGKELLPPGLPPDKPLADQLMSFPAELRITWGQRQFVMPLKAIEILNGWTWERGYEGVLPDIGVLDDTVTTIAITTTDKRRSKELDYAYEPVRTTATIKLPIVNGRLVDSKLADEFPNADISKGTIHRGSRAAGYEGDDTFFLTTQLKNGWKVTRVELGIVGSHYGGAQVVESRVGTESLYVKVHWYIIYVFPPLMEFDFVDYDLAFHLTGPAGQPFF